MKVSDVPAQIVVVGAEILTDGVTEGLTVMVMELEVAVRGEAQPALEVITHDTTCPFVSVDVVYVGLLVPTFVPPTIH